MIVFLVRRLVQGIVTVACVYTLTFLMVVTIPGNPLQQGERRIAKEVEQALRLRYNMDDNWRYFGQFIAGAVHFDFGPSFTYADWTCGQIIAASLPVSVTIGFLAIALALLVGVPLGVWSAARRHTWVDRSIQSFLLLGISLPTFVIGGSLLMLIAVGMKLVPIGGWGRLGHLPLPVVTLAIPYCAYIARLTRVGMIDVLGSDFIRTELSKGLTRRTVIWNHALRVGFLPVLSYLGPAAAQAMTGSFVVEKVFSIPGLGQHFINAALNRDAGLIMSTVLVFSTMLVALNVFGDCLHARLDPRVGRP